MLHIYLKLPGQQNLGVAVAGVLAYEVFVADPVLVADAERFTQRKPMHIKPIGLICK